MNRFTVGMLAVLFGLIVTVSTVSAAELAKEGSGKYRSGRTAEINVLKMGEEHMQINFDETGVVVDAPADSPYGNHGTESRPLCQIVQKRLFHGNFGGDDPLEDSINH